MMSPTVYMSQENSEWTAQLETKLRRIGPPFETWNLATGQLPLAITPPRGVFYSRISASAHTRGNRYPPEHTAAALHWLERHDAIELNGTRALELELTKAAQHLVLETCAFAPPKPLSSWGRNSC